MTGIAFSLVFIGFLLVACVNLPFGILAWLWMALQSPHQVVGVDLPFNLAIVIACLIGLLMNRKQIVLWADGTIILLVVLVFHTGLTTLLAYNPDYSYPYFDRLWKTVLLALFVAAYMGTRTRLQAVTWVMALSIALLSVKGFVFTILTAGQFRVFGPPATQITDNNLFAGAICIALPSVIYLRQTTANPAVRSALGALAFAMPCTVLFTYSRGGLLALLSVGLCYFLQSKRKVPIVIACVALFTLAVPMMPSQWLTRMSTISETVQDTDKADDSVKGRFNAWYVYSQIALDRPFIGGGFRAPEVLSVWQMHIPDATRQEGAKAAHNNIFQVMGEHGLFGLGIYLLIVFLALKNVAAVVVRTRHAPELRWARQMAIAQGISLVAYNVAGLTVSLPYYDYFIVLVVHVASLHRLVSQTLSPTASAQSAEMAKPGPLRGRPIAPAAGLSHAVRRTRE